MSDTAVRKSTEPLRPVDLIDGPIRFEGAVSVARTAEGVIPWRLDRADRDLIDDSLLGVAQVPAGVRLTFESDTRALDLALSNPATEHASVDLVVDGRLIETRPLTPGRSVLRFDNLPPGNKCIELYLPTYGITTVHGVSIDAGANCRPWEDRRPRWVTYGSSLTMCRRAHSPTRAWPAMVSRALGWHLTQLGFAGQCKIDPIVARTIGRLPADVISLCLGINTYAGEFSPRTWLPAVTGFVLTVRDAHPTTPLMLFSPMYSAPRESTPGPTGLTLQLMRQWLAELVERLRARGDRHVAHVDGLEVFGPPDAHHMPDQLHPGGDGIELMGRRIERIFRHRLPLIGGEHLLDASTPSPAG